MRTFQYWALVLLSSLVSILMIKEIFLTRALKQQQLDLVDSQQTASTAQGFENAWQKVAMKIFEVGRQDPGLIQLLKSANVEVRSTPPGEPNAAATPGASTPVAVPVAPIHPATP
jgi:hypothetical protein